MRNLIWKTNHGCWMYRALTRTVFLVRISIECIFQVKKFYDNNSPWLFSSLNLILFSIEYTFLWIFWMCLICPRVFLKLQHFYISTDLCISGWIWQIWVLRKLPADSALAWRKLLKVTEKQQPGKILWLLLLSSKIIPPKWQLFKHWNSQLQVSQYSFALHRFACFLALKLVLWVWLCGFYLFNDNITDIALENKKSLHLHMD